MSTENIHDGGFNHLLHSVQTATVPGCTTPEAIGVAAENLSAAGAFDSLPVLDTTVLHDQSATVEVGGRVVRSPKTFIPFGI